MVEMRYQCHEVNIILSKPHHGFKIIKKKVSFAQHVIALEERHLCLRISTALGQVRLLENHLENHYSSN